MLRSADAFESDISPVFSTMYRYTASSFGEIRVIGGGRGEGISAGRPNAAPQWTHETASLGVSAPQLAHRASGRLRSVVPPMLAG